MPIHVRASTALGISVVVFDGIVTLEGFEHHVAPLVEKPEFGLMPLTLVDMTTATRGVGSSEIIRSFARRAAHHIDGKIGDGSRMAIVASLDEFFGIGRMYQALRDDSPVAIQVFRDLGEAERWLGLPSDYADQLIDVLDTP